MYKRQVGGSIVSGGTFAEKEIDGQQYMVLPMAAASATFVRGNQIFVRADNVPSGAFLKMCIRDRDMTDIPKTIEDNGHTLTFSDIEWTPETEETDNLGTMETTYTAVVTYTGTATSSRTTGYTVTATYAGEVSHRNNDCMRYIAVYSGEQIVIEPEDNTAVSYTHLVLHICVH